MLGVEGDAVRFFHLVTRFAFNLPTWRHIAIVVDTPNSDKGAVRFGQRAVKFVSDDDPAFLRLNFDLTDVIQTRFGSANDTHRFHVAVGAPVKNEERSHAVSR